MIDILQYYKGEHPRRYKRWETLINKAYVDDNFKLGRDSLYSYLKLKQPAKHQHPTKRFVAAFIRQFESNQIYAPVRKARTIKSFTAKHMNHTLQMDTAFVLQKNLVATQDKPAGISASEWKTMQNQMKADLQKEGYTYGRDATGMITAVDIASRRAYARPVLNQQAKTAGMVVVGGADGYYNDPVNAGKRTKSIIREAEDYAKDKGFENARVKFIITDKGPEFMGSGFQDALSAKQTTDKAPNKYISRFAFEGKSQAQGIVERFNGTIKRIVRKLSPLKDNGRPQFKGWHKILSTAMQVYDIKPHKTIGMPPNSVTLANISEAVGSTEKNSAAIEKKDAPLKAGDYVRMRMYNASKVYGKPNWSWKQGPLVLMGGDKSVYKGVYLINRVYSEKHTTTDGEDRRVKARTYGVVGIWNQTGQTERNSKKVEKVNIPGNEFHGRRYPDTARERRFVQEEMLLLTTDSKGAPIVRRDLKQHKQPPAAGKVVRTRAGVVNNKPKPKTKPKPTPTKPGDDREYEVKDILHWDTVDGKRKYEVTWKGYPDTSWESAATLNHLSVWKRKHKTLKRAP